VSDFCFVFFRSDFVSERTIIIVIVECFRIAERERKRWAVVVCLGERDKRE